MIKPLESRHEVVRNKGVCLKSSCCYGDDDGDDDTDSLVEYRDKIGKDEKEKEAAIKNDTFTF